jgi:hypothetical protein
VTELVDYLATHVPHLTGTYRRRVGKGGSRATCSSRDCPVGGSATRARCASHASEDTNACKAFLVSTGFNLTNGTYGNYANGVGFCIANGNRFFIGCDCQDADGRRSG